MRFRRVVAATTAAVLAGGAALLISTQGCSAATPPPTPITLAETGLGTSFCPLPINGTVAIKPGTTVQFTPPACLDALNKYTLRFCPRPRPTRLRSRATYDVPNAGTRSTFPTARHIRAVMERDRLALGLAGSPR